MQSEREEELNFERRAAAGPPRGSQGIQVRADAGRAAAQCAQRQRDRGAEGRHRRQQGGASVVASPGATARAPARSRGWIAPEPLPVSTFQERPAGSLQRITPSDTSFNFVAYWVLDGVAEGTVLLRRSFAVSNATKSLRSTLPGRIGCVLECLPAAGRCRSFFPKRKISLAGLRSYERLSSGATRRRVDPPIRSLTTKPPARVHAVRLGDARWGVAMSVHHIALDAWSLGPARAGADGNSSLGSRRTASGRAVRRFRRAGSASARARGCRERPGVVDEEADGCSAALCCSPDRPHLTDTAGAVRLYRFAPELSAAVRRLARENNVTPYMVLVAATAAVLRWHTGQGEAVFGSPMGVRGLRETESMIGPFVNLRCCSASIWRTTQRSRPCSDACAMRRWTRTLTATCRSNRCLGEALAASNFRSFALLLQMALGPSSNAPARSGGIARSGGAMAEITMYVREAEQDGLKLGIRVSYRPFHAGGDRSHRLAHRSRAGARRSGHGQPGSASCAVLTDAERRRVVQELNATDAPRDTTVFPRAFEQEVRRRAASTAVAATCEGQSISYTELSRRANQLAWPPHHERRDERLTRRGVRASPRSTSSWRCSQCRSQARRM